MTQYFAGLDLGQAHQFTALAVLEKSSVCEAGKSAWTTAYAVRHLERFAIATPYAEVFERLKALFAKPPLQRAPLIVDQTGVGRAVIDMLRKANVTKPVLPVTITSAAMDGHGGRQVPKQDLVATLQVLLQTRRIKVAESLPEAAVLVQELSNFQAKPAPLTADPLTAWREGAHDDLVLAVAVAAWWAERQLSPGGWGRPFVIEWQNGW